MKIMFLEFVFFAISIILVIFSIGKMNSREVLHASTPNFANKSTIIVIHKASFPHIVRGSKKSSSLVCLHNLRRKRDRCFLSNKSKVQKSGRNQLEDNFLTFFPKSSLPPSCLYLVLTVNEF